VGLHEGLDELSCSLILEGSGLDPCCFQEVPEGGMDLGFLGDKGS